MYISICIYIHRYIHTHTETGAAQAPTSSKVGVIRKAFTHTYIERYGNKHEFGPLRKRLPRHM